jgi:hypothetical protein
MVKVSCGPEADMIMLVQLMYILSGERSGFYPALTMQDVNFANGSFFAMIVLRSTTHDVLLGSAL